MDQFTILQSNQITQEIKKSEFIASLYPVSSVEEANEILKQTKKKYYDATHNCYAYIIKNDDQEIKKASDDGEPSQTAGVVILDVLEKKNIINAMIIVTRYFGGIKLGAGGLVRAYSSSASLSLEGINLIKVQKYTNIKLTFSYELIHDIEKYLQTNSLETEIISKTFLQNVEFEIKIPESYKQKLIEEIIDISKNKVIFN